MKVQYSRPIETPKTVHEMQVGQVAFLDEGDYSGRLILRIYKGAVLLDDPNKTWGDCCSLRVSILPPGTRITLTSEV